MAALSAKRVTKSRRLGHKVKYLMKASTTCYQGGIVVLDSSGLAIPAAAASGNKQAVGIAVASVTSAASGSYYIEVMEGEFLLTADAITQAHTGDMMFCNDDQTFDDTQGSNEPALGKLIEFVSTTSGWVRVGPMTAIA